VENFLNTARPGTTPHHPVGRLAAIPGYLLQAPV